jgi:hypothetical protein
MRILLVSGHKSGHNACRTTGVNEGDLNVELVRKLHALLSPYAQVDVYPYERDMYQDNKNGCLKVSLKDYRYIFEVHFNAGGGRGTSVQLHSSYRGGISVEQAVVDNVAALGFKKRGSNGIVRRSDLLNMNTALRLGIDYALIETCFYDSAADMALYRQKKETVAQAIANGIIDRFGLKGGSSGTTSGQSAKTVTVTGCTALNIRTAPNGPIVAETVEAGTVLEVTGSGKDSDGDTWLQVKYGSLTGFVWPKYVKGL